MEIKKLKAVKNEYHEMAGPSQAITLGFVVGEDSYILGSFYFGPGMLEDQIEYHNRLDRFIDHVVKTSNNSLNSDGEKRAAG